VELSEKLVPDLRGKLTPKPKESPVVAVDVPAMPRTTETPKVGVEARPKLMVSCAPSPRLAGVVDVWVKGVDVDRVEESEKLAPEERGRAQPTKADSPRAAVVVSARPSPAFTMDESPKLDPEVLEKTAPAWAVSPTAGVDLPGIARPMEDPITAEEILG